MEVLGHQEVRRYWPSGNGVKLYFASPEQPNTWKCAIRESALKRKVNNIHTYIVRYTISTLATYSKVTSNKPHTKNYLPLAMIIVDSPFSFGTSKGVQQGRQLLTFFLN